MNRLHGLSVALFLAVLSTTGACADQREEVRADLVRILTEVFRPFATLPEDGKAWHLAGEGTIAGRKGTMDLVWDGRSRHAVRLDLPDLGAFSAGFGEKKSWLYLPRFDKLFLAEHEKPEGQSLLRDCRVWKIFKTQAASLPTLAMFVDIPEEWTLARDSSGSIRISDSRDFQLEILEETDGALLLKSTSKKVPGELRLTSWKQVALDEVTGFFSPPGARTSEKVDVEDLRWMFRTMADFGAESILARVNPKSVPDPMRGVPKEQGIAVVKFSGSPEAMGTRHGTLLKEAIHYNVHHTLHGVGFLTTVQTGSWLPGELEETWETQKKYIPDRYVREVEAMAKAADLRLDWAREATIYPERFHCSGFALRGKATDGGTLYHGRILDYMTQGGLQNTATVMIFEPEGRNAWVSIGYAGQCSTVSAMNEKGLAMGEMGGGGNGYVDGFPMTLLMREIMERFETTEQALAWMKQTPRTCEYFYCISDARTKEMAGVASYARKLAEERGVDDLQIIRPGQYHPLLDRPVEDAVLLSADRRYQNLVDRVRRNYGKIDMEKAWEIMDAGVAMTSNLHSVLFAPETLEFWTSQAGPLGEPAYTQPVAKFNLRELLRKEKVTRTSDAGRR